MECLFCICSDLSSVLHGSQDSEKGFTKGVFLSGSLYILLFSCANKIKCSSVGTQSEKLSNMFNIMTLDDLKDDAFLNLAPYLVKSTTKTPWGHTVYSCCSSQRIEQLSFQSSLVLCLGRLGITAVVQQDMLLRNRSIGIQKTPERCTSAAVSLPISYRPLFILPRLLSKAPADPGTIQQIALP